VVGGRPWSLGGKLGDGLCQDGPHVPSRFVSYTSSPRLECHLTQTPLSLLIASPDLVFLAGQGRRERWYTTSYKVAHRGTLYISVLVRSFLSPILTPDILTSLSDSSLKQSTDAATTTDLRNSLLQGPAEFVQRTSG